MKGQILSLLKKDNLRMYFQFFKEKIIYLISFRKDLFLNNKYIRFISWNYINITNNK